MKLYNIFKNMTLSKDSFEGSIIPSKSDSSKSVVFESDSIVSLDIDGVIDTNDELTIAKYRNNLRLLVNEALSKGCIDKFAIIRNDDFFPVNFEWTVNSSNTNIELSGSTFTYELRYAYAKKLAGVNNNSFGINIPSKKDDDIMASFDYDFAKVYTPTVFRATKHFTVNTPLGYTHDYNQVESSRLFTIIDNIDNFTNSGYAYTISYRDSYLDITHATLPISENAIVMISKDNYDKMSNNSEFQEQLSKFGNRKLIIFKGDESVAINMALTSIGILPSKVDFKNFEYDSDIKKIIDVSIIQYSESHSIEYNIGHGNLNGKGGHFSDRLDSLNNSKHYKYIDFINYLKDKLKNEYEVDERIMINSDIAASFINKVGVDRLLDIVNEYNKYMEQEIKIRYDRYITDRHSITPEINNLFKITLKVINAFYKNINELYIEYEDLNIIENMFSDFFYADTVSEQVNIATNICKRFNVEIEDNYSNINNL